ncbi:hypothetical protein EAE99_005374 [Botrytis elliptica]|nr:hypothetical protein EAE99_005374 [Botrytis elliptica]
MDKYFTLGPLDSRLGFQVWTLDLSGIWHLISPFLELSKQNNKAMGTIRGARTRRIQVVDTVATCSSWEMQSELLMAIGDLLLE